MFCYDYTNILYLKKEDSFAKKVIAELLRSCHHLKALVNTWFTPILQIKVFLPVSIVK